MRSTPLSQQLEAEWLSRLSSFFEAPNRDQKRTLEDTAWLLEEGKLDWDQVETAIAYGWDPGSEDILHYLAGSEEGVASEST